MTPSLDRIMRVLVEEGGFTPGTSLENAAAYRLSRWGHRATDVVQQHHVGRYRLDFAWPSLKIALELDGWHHQSPRGAVHDAERDSWLRSEGWLVFRVDDQSDIEPQLLRVHLVVRALQDWS